MDLKKLNPSDDVLTSELENIYGGAKDEPIKIYCKTGAVILQPKKDEGDGDE